jgi:hypothetical protein
LISSIRLQLPVHPEYQNQTDEKYDCKHDIGIQGFQVQGNESQAAQHNTGKVDDRNCPFAIEPSLYKTMVGMVVASFVKGYAPPQAG